MSPARWTVQIEVQNEKYNVVGSVVGHVSCRSNVDHFDPTYQILSDGTHLSDIDRRQTVKFTSEDPRFCGRW